jgi:hypothetical protein
MILQRLYHASGHLRTFGSLCRREGASADRIWQHFISKDLSKWFCTEVKLMFKPFTIFFVER